jgi:type I restriction enzyme, S subunit
VKLPWQKVRLGEVLALSNNAIPVAELTEVNLAGVYSFGRGLFKRGTTSPRETSYRTYNRLVADDFVISIPKAWEGALARVTPEFDGWFLSPVFPTFRAERQRLEPVFLEWFCKRQTVWAQLQHKSRGIGARRESLHPEQFLSLEIPLPPLPEQRRIVARIEELAAQINEARTLRQRATEEAEALVVSNHLRLAGNRKRRLGEFLQLHEDSVPIQPEGSYPQVGVKSFGAGLFAKAPVSGTETTYRTFNRLYDGALVLSQVKGWEGALAICPGQLVGWLVSPEYRTFRCIEGEALPGYLAPVVRSQWFWGRLTHATRGVGARRERTRPEQFLNVEIPMPDLVRQQAGERMFGELETLKGLQGETAAELDALLPAILDRAFKGEL